MGCNQLKTANRVQNINAFLMRHLKTLYRLRKVGVPVSNGKQVYAYVISLKKDPDRTLEEQIRLFYDICQGLLVDGENLTTDKVGFRISSDKFEACYRIEIWQKRADKTAYIEDGQVKVALLHRMSCEQAALVFRKNRIDPLEFVNRIPALEEYDNPADKYAALAKSSFLKTLLAKQKDV